MRVVPQRCDWGGETHPECGWHCPMGQHHRPSKMGVWKKAAGFSLLTVGAHDPLPCLLPAPAGAILSAVASPP